MHFGDPRAIDLWCDGQIYVACCIDINDRRRERQEAQQIPERPTSTFSDICARMKRDAEAAFGRKHRAAHKPSPSLQRLPPTKSIRSADFVKRTLIDLWWF